MTPPGRRARTMAFIQEVDALAWRDSPPQEHPEALENQSAACVLGFGDIYGGDMGFACCVIDALLQLDPGPGVTVAYCGCDFRGIEAWLFKAREVHVVLGAALGGRPGEVRTPDWTGLRLADRLAEGVGTFLVGMNTALVRLAMLEAIPARLTFHVAEPRFVTGLGMSRAVLRAARSTALRILEGLGVAGLPVGSTKGTNRLFRSDVLRRTF